MVAYEVRQLQAEKEVSDVQAAEVGHVLQAGQH